MAERTQSPSPFASRLLAKAGRNIVYPLNRDECIALVELAQAAEALWNCDAFNLTGAEMDVLQSRLEAALARVGGLKAETMVRHA